jgi:hypothetical protein
MLLLSDFPLLRNSIWDGDENIQIHGEVLSMDITIRHSGTLPRPPTATLFTTHSTITPHAT